MVHSIKTGAKSALALSAIIVAGAMAFQSATAQAADLPARVDAPAPAPVYAPPVFTWTGFYIGANAGWGTGRDKVGFSVTPATTFPNIGNLNRSGFIGGAQAGYNWQYGSLVVGLETDIQYAGMRDKLGPVALAGGGTASASSRLNWYGTLRPRVGYAFGRTLLFATGGLAYGNPRYTLTAVDGAGNTFAINNSSTKVGWTVGGGLEHAFTNNWSAKLEYGYVNFGTSSGTANVLTAGGAPTGNTATSRLRNDFHTVRAGINYRF